MDKALKHPYKEVFKAVDTDGNIVGAALWDTPKPEGYKEEKKDKILPPGTNLELAEAFFSQFGVLEPGHQPRYRTSLVPLVRLFHQAPILTFLSSLSLLSTIFADLSILVVDPSRQRTGAGSALLRWGTRKADEDGVICSLKATDGESLSDSLRKESRTDNPPFKVAVPL
jgi:GNAT superfamily N-acetyltransferase